MHGPMNVKLRDSTFRVTVHKECNDESYLQIMYTTRNFRVVYHI